MGHTSPASHKDNREINTTNHFGPVLFEDLYPKWEHRCFLSSHSLSSMQMLPLPLNSIKKLLQFLQSAETNILTVGAIIMQGMDFAWTFLKWCPKYARVAADCAICHQQMILSIRYNQMILPMNTLVTGTTKPLNTSGNATNFPHLVWNVQEVTPLSAN